ncbi:MAG: tRNA (adenosine(37)-N6)-dimethylallyltransferase MiaA [Oscillospiraceae bacterium]
MGKIVVVAGPTATGKSALALFLAQRFGGEVVGADSMQIYRGLRIGTAAITQEEACGVPLHLMGFLPPDAPFSVAAWLKMAHGCIGEIHARGAVPIVCGGTGLYLSSLLQGVRFEQETDTALRAQLEADWRQQGGQAMLARLAACDPGRAEKLHLQDKKRILRALEQALQTRMTAEAREAQSTAGGPPYSALCLGLNHADRAGLYAAIEARVDAMMEEGLLQEARGVFENRDRYKTAVQAIGYKEFFPYFESEAPLEACVQKLKQATRNYAKRQLTWFRRMDDMHWLDATSPALREQAGQRAAAFLKA